MVLRLLFGLLGLATLVTGAADPDRCTATGLGLTEGVAGQLAHINVTLLDSVVFDFYATCILSGCRRETLQTML